MSDKGEMMRPNGSGLAGLVMAAAGVLVISSGCESNRNVETESLRATPAGSTVLEEENVLPANRPVDATDPNIDLR